MKTWSMSHAQEKSQVHTDPQLLIAGIESEYGKIKGTKVSKLSSPESYSCIQGHRYIFGYRHIYVYRFIRSCRYIHAYGYMLTYSCIQGWTGGHLPTRAAWLLLSMARLRSTLQAQQAWVKAHPAPACGASKPSSFSHHHPCFSNSMISAM